MARRGPSPEPLLLSGLRALGSEWTESLQLTWAEDDFGNLVLSEPARGAGRQATIPFLHVVKSTDAGGNSATVFLNRQRFGVCPEHDWTFLPMRAFEDLVAEGFEVYVHRAEDEQWLLLRAQGGMQRYEPKMSDVNGRHLVAKVKHHERATLDALWQELRAACGSRFPEWDALRAATVPGDGAPSADRGALVLDGRGDVYYRGYRLLLGIGGAVSIAFYDSSAPHAWSARVQGSNQMLDALQRAADPDARRRFVEQVVGREAPLSCEVYTAPVAHAEAALGSLLSHPSNLERIGAIVAAFWEASATVPIPRRAQEQDLRSVLRDLGIPRSVTVVSELACYFAEKAGHAPWQLLAQDLQASPAAAVLGSLQPLALFLGALFAEGVLREMPLRVHWKDRNPLTFCSADAAHHVNLAFGGYGVFAGLCLYLPTRFAAHAPAIADAAEAAGLLGARWRKSPAPPPPLPPPAPAAAGTAAAAAAADRPTALSIAISILVVHLIQRHKEARSGREHFLVGASYSEARGLWELRENSRDGMRTGERPFAYVCAAHRGDAPAEYLFCSFDRAPPARPGAAGALVGVLSALSDAFDVRALPQDDAALAEGPLAAEGPAALAFSLAARGEGAARAVGAALDPAGSFLHAGGAGGGQRWWETPPCAAPANGEKVLFDAHCRGWLYFHGFAIDARQDMPHLGLAVDGLEVSGAGARAYDFPFLLRRWRAALKAQQELLQAALPHLQRSGCRFVEALARAWAAAEAELGPRARLQPVSAHVAASAGAAMGAVFRQQDFLAAAAQLLKRFCRRTGRPVARSEAEAALLPGAPPAPAPLVVGDALYLLAAQEHFRGADTTPDDLPCTALHAAGRRLARRAPRGAGGAAQRSLERLLRETGVLGGGALLVCHDEREMPLAFFPDRGVHHANLAVLRERPRAFAAGVLLAQPAARLLRCMLRGDALAARGAFSWLFQHHGPPSVAWAPPAAPAPPEAAAAAIPAPALGDLGDCDAVSAMAAAPGGGLVLGTLDGLLLLLGADGGAPRALGRHGARVCSLAGHGRLFASGDALGALRLLRLREDGGAAPAGALGGGAQDPLLSLRFAAGGGRLAGGTARGFVHLWAREAGGGAWRLAWSARGFRPAARGPRLREDLAPALGVALLEDGRSLLAVGEQGDVKVWATDAPPREAAARAAAGAAGLEGRRARARAERGAERGRPLPRRRHDARRRRVPRGGGRRVGLRLLLRGAHRRGRRLRRVGAGRRGRRLREQRRRRRGGAGRGRRLRLRGRLARSVRRGFTVLRPVTALCYAGDGRRAEATTGEYEGPAAAGGGAATPLEWILVEEVPREAALGKRSYAELLRDAEAAIAPRQALRPPWEDLEAAVPAAEEAAWACGNGA